MSEDILKLSKNVLRLKFMQRSLNAETRRKLEENEKKFIDDEQWYLDLPELTAKQSLVVQEMSFVPCEDLLYGRMSFKGFNPTVEKLMTLLNSKTSNDEDEEDVSQMETDITDEDMALRYESLVESMKNKFSKKHKRKSMEDEDEKKMEPEKKKNMFMKPQD